MKDREVSKTENRVVRRKVHLQPPISDSTALDAPPSAGMMAAAAALYGSRIFEQEQHALRGLSDERNGEEVLEMPISMTVLMGPDGRGDGGQDVPLDIDIMH